VAALVVLPTAAAAIPGRLAGATAPQGRATTWTAPRATASPARAAKGGTATLVSVKVTTAGDGPVSKDRDPIRTAAGRRRLTSSGCSNPGPGSSAYSLSGTRVSGPTTAHLNPAGAIGGAASALQAAFNTWKAADPNAPSISVASDGAATTPTADHSDEIMFSSTAGRLLAVTYTWRWSTGEYESDIVFGTNVPWFQAPSEGSGCYQGVSAYDFQDVATHEVGHVYGLAHVTSLFNTMYPTATLGETYKRSLAPGDAAGIRAIY
jgi:hypothetical protein